MAIKSRNKKGRIQYVIYVGLGVFAAHLFMITSTLISPNAIKLLLPSSKSKTMSKQNVTVYINDQFDYYLDKRRIGENELEAVLANELTAFSEGTVVLRSDKSVPVQYVVTVIDAINGINKQTGQKHKVILATSPAK